MRVKNQLSIALDLLFEARTRALGRDYSPALWHAEVGLSSTEISRLRWIPDGTPATRQPASVMLRLLGYLAECGLAIKPRLLPEMAETSWLEAPTEGLVKIREHLFPSGEGSASSEGSES